MPNKPSKPTTGPHQRHDTLRIKRGRDAATHEQIVDGFPDLFDKESYLTSAEKVLDQFTQLRNLKKHLEPDDLKLLEQYLMDLIEHIKEILREEMQFSVQHKKSRTGRPIEVEEEKAVKISIPNVDQLIVATNAPSRELQQFVRVSELIDELESEIGKLRVSISKMETGLANKEKREVRADRELDDLLDKGIDAAFKRRDLNRKKKLEKELAQLEEDIVEINSKLQQQEDEITDCQQKITSIIQEALGYLKDAESKEQSFRCEVHE